MTSFQGQAAGNYLGHAGGGGLGLAPPPSDTAGLWGGGRAGTPLPFTHVNIRTVHWTSHQLNVNREARHPPRPPSSRSDLPAVGPSHN